MADSEPTSKPKPQYGDIPAELSFEQVVRNRASPPCSLTDFMDYLVHVEHSAEPLQFFLWYWDYLERWSALLPRQKALSPPWDPDKAAEPPSRFIRYSHKRERSRKMGKVIAIMEMGSELALAEAEANGEEAKGEEGKEGRLSSASSVRSASSSSSSSSSTRTAILSPTTTSSEGADSQPSPPQPYRTELSHLTRHYLHPSPTTPRPLPLSPSDRAACLLATQHTTHPSALLPAFLAADATLRARSHPAFARWARRNANRARVRFLLALGAALVLLGCAADALLVLSGVSVFWRVGCLGLWWPGLVVLGAAARGVCVVLCVRGRRQVRPWEGAVGGEEGGGFDGDDGAEWGGSGWGDTKGEGFGNVTTVVGAGSKRGSGSSVGKGKGDPLRKASLRPFGPANDYSGKEWKGAYRAKGWTRRVFDDTVAVQSKALAMWQDRAVMFAVLWGGAGATALTVVSLFIPSVRLLG